MIYLITGANGLVGSFLCAELLKQGHHIKAIKRSSSDLSLVKNIEAQIEWITCDVSDMPALEEAMKGVDIVIHTAAIISFHPSNKDFMYTTNVQGTANVVNAALNTKVKKLCYVSSIASIGTEKENIPSTEKTQWEESEQHTHYSRSKYLAELEVWRAIEEGLNAFIVNPSIILGPGNWNNGSTKLFKYVYNKNSYYTKGLINYVDVRDLTTCILSLLNANAHAQRYIISGGHIPYKNFFESIASHFNVKAPYKEVSAWVAEIVWRFFRIKSWFSKSEPLITKETARLGKRPTIYDNSKIKTTLAFEFHSLHDTVQWTCQELIKKNSL